MTRDDLRIARIMMTAAVLCAGVAASSAQTVTPWSNLQTVFIIVLENHDWSEIKGNPSAPYINSLLSRFAHAERYFNPPGLHPSLPNCYFYYFMIRRFVGGCGANTNRSPRSMALAASPRRV